MVPGVGGYRKKVFLKFNALRLQELRFVFCELSVCCKSVSKTSLSYYLNSRAGELNDEGTEVKIDVYD